jgi:hypothetical protein
LHGVLALLDKKQIWVGAIWRVDMTDDDDKDWIAMTLAILSDSRSFLDLEACRRGLKDIPHVSLV